MYSVTGIGHGSEHHRQVSNGERRPLSRTVSPEILLVVEDAVIQVVDEAQGKGAIFVLPHIRTLRCRLQRAQFE